MTMTVRKGSILIAYTIQSFSKFLVPPFWLILSPCEDNLMQIRRGNAGGEATLEGYDSKLQFYGGIE